MPRGPLSLTSVTPVSSAGTSQHDPALHSHVQWMTQTPTSGHQVIILHAPPEQQVSREVSVRLG